MLRQLAIQCYTGLKNSVAVWQARFLEASALGVLRQQNSQPFAHV